MSNQWSGRHECIKHHICEKEYVWTLVHVFVEMENIWQVLWMIQ